MDVAEINRRRWLEESGLRLDNVYQNHLARDNGNLIQKTFAIARKFLWTIIVGCYNKIVSSQQKARSFAPGPVIAKPEQSSSLNLPKAQKERLARAFAALQKLINSHIEGPLKFDQIKYEIFSPQIGF